MKTFAILARYASRGGKYVMSVSREEDGNVMISHWTGSRLTGEEHCVADLESRLSTLLACYAEDGIVLVAS